MKTFGYLLILMLTVSTVFFMSCEKKENSELGTDYYSRIIKEAMASNETDITFILAESLFSDFIKNQKVGRGVSQASKVVALPTIDKISEGEEYPKVYEIDYGNNFIDIYGRTVSGIVRITEGKPGTYKKYETKNLTINNNIIKAKKSMSNQGNKNPGERTLEIILNDTIILANNNIWVRNTTRTRKWIDDNGTPDVWTDDKYSFTGTTYGTNPKGDKYSIVIDDFNPLIISGMHKYYVSGVITTTTKSGEAILDFGDGTEENIATISVNGRASNAITLNW